MAYAQYKKRCIQRIQTRTYKENAILIRQLKAELKSRNELIEKLEFSIDELNTSTKEMKGRIPMRYVDDFLEKAAIILLDTIV